MEREMIINEPCPMCDSSQCEVILTNEGLMTIVCTECKSIIAKGYTSSPWNLLSKDKIPSRNDSG